MADKNSGKVWAAALLPLTARGFWMIMVVFAALYSAQVFFRYDRWWLLSVVTLSIGYSRFYLQNILVTHRLLPLPVLRALLPGLAGGCLMQVGLFGLVTLASLFGWLVLLAVPVALPFLIATVALSSVRRPATWTNLKHVMWGFDPGLYVAILVSAGVALTFVFVEMSPLVLAAFTAPALDSHPLRAALALSAEAVGLWSLTIMGSAVLGRYLLACLGVPEIS